MTDEDFAAALDRWGADLDRWPPAEAADAAALLRTSLAARSDFDAMLAVEHSLVRTAPPAPPALDPLLAAIIRHKQDRPAAVVWRRRAAVLGAAVLIAGLLTGALTPQPPNPWFTTAFAAPAGGIDVD